MMKFLISLVISLVSISLVANVLALGYLLKLDRKNCKPKVELQFVPRQ